MNGNSFNSIRQNLYPRVQLPISQHCFWKWYGIEQATIGNNDGMSYWRIYASLTLDELANRSTKYSHACAFGKIWHMHVRVSNVTFLTACPPPLSYI